MRPPRSKASALTGKRRGPRRARSPPPPLPPKAWVTLGLDLGSTGLRLVLYNAITGEKFHIVNDDQSLITHRWRSSNFPAHGFPMGDGEKVYQRSAPNPSQEAVPLKFAIYMLANATAALLKEHVLVKALKEKVIAANSEDRLVQGLKEMLQVVWNAVQKMCSDRNLEVKIVGLSIPVQWDLDFEGVYREIVSEAFNMPLDAIHCAYEPACLVHLLCKDYWQRIFTDNVPAYILLVIDVGGHTTGVCMYHVSCQKDEPPRIYSMEDAAGVAGGSEVWEFLVKNKVRAFVEQQLGQDGQGEVDSHVWQILEHFSSRKGQLGRTDLPQPFTVKIGNCKMEMSHEEVTECRETAMRGVRDLIEQWLRKPDSRRENARNTAEEVHPKIKIVVSGGSANHEEFRAEVETMCVDEGLPPPIFTRDLGLEHEESRLAIGAAIATSSCMPVAKFLEKAGFGLQIRQARTDKWGTMRLGQRNWTATVLLGPDPTEETAIEILSGDESRLICDPEYAIRENKEALHFAVCYDFLDMGKFPAGWYNFVMSIERAPVGDEHKLRLQWKRQEEETFHKVLEELVYVDRNTNCLHVGAIDADRKLIEARVSNIQRGTSLVLAEDTRQELITRVLEKLQVFVHQAFERKRNELPPSSRHKRKRPSTNMRFACPFAKHDPELWERCGEFADTEAVKEHLEQRHLQTNRTQTRRPRATPGPPPPVQDHEFLTQEKWDTIRKIQLGAINQDEVFRWKQYYIICFNVAHNAVPSPYHWDAAEYHEEALELQRKPLDDYEEFFQARVAGDAELKQLLNATVDKLQMKANGLKLFKVATKHVKGMQEGVLGLYRDSLVRRGDGKKEGEEFDPKRYRLDL